MRSGGCEGGVGGILRVEGLKFSSVYWIHPILQ